MFQMNLINLNYLLHILYVPCTWERKLSDDLVTTLQTQLRNLTPLGIFCVPVLGMVLDCSASNLDLVSQNNTGRCLTPIELLSWCSVEFRIGAHMPWKTENEAHAIKEEDFQEPGS